MLLLLLLAIRIPRELDGDYIKNMPPPLVGEENPQLL